MIKRIKPAQFADNLVYCYAKFDRMDQCYRLDTKTIPDFDLHEFATLIIKEEPDLAKEATSSDNPYYEKVMLPALLKYMANSTDKELRQDFDEAWLEGITRYLEATMQYLIDDQCRERVSSEKYSGGYTPRMNKDNGETRWGIK